MFQFWSGTYLDKYKKNYIDNVNKNILLNLNIIYFYLK